MTTEIKTHRLRFNRALEPFKVMLMNRKGDLTLEDWLHLVNRTKHGVLTEPDQYLGKELPDKEAIQKVVERIFFEFLKEQGN